MPKQQKGGIVAKLGTKARPAILRVQSIVRAGELTRLADEHGIMVIVGVEPDKPEDISDLVRILEPPTPLQKAAKVGRNEPCPCGSGKKYKRCCGG